MIVRNIRMDASSLFQKFFAAKNEMKPRLKKDIGEREYP